MAKEYNDIAELIINTNFAYKLYENTSNIINIHASLSKVTKGNNRLIDIEDLDFESFEPNYLKALAEKWYNKNEDLKTEYQSLLYGVDTDDYK